MHVCVYIYIYRTLGSSEKEAWDAQDLGCLHTHMYEYTTVCTHIEMFTHTHVYECTNVCTHMYIPMYTYVCLYAFVYLYLCTQHAGQRGEAGIGHGRHADVYIYIFI